MKVFAGIADRDRIQAARPYTARNLPGTLYHLLCQTEARVPENPAISFQLFSEPNAGAETLTWTEFRERVTETANMFRDLGVGPEDTIAYLLPNCTEAPIVLLAGATAGIVNPINPLLDVEQIAALLQQSRAKVVVTLRAFPETDIAEKTAEAVRLCPNVETVLEVDLARYLPIFKRVAVRILRPRVRTRHHARVLDFEAESSSRRHDRLSFTLPEEDRIAAYFHTGGTTGMPKLAQHYYSGMIYNGWIGSELLFTDRDVLMCPLPMFHVFAAYPILMSCLASGAELVMPTPAGYRGKGVFENFWKLIERWQATFLITVPTAIAALMQHKVNADVSSLRSAISGSAPLSVELYNRFKAATGVEIAEGYGLTEATCLVSCNPIDGLKKHGSVGIPFPYTDIRIIRQDTASPEDCAIDEVGEICVASPGVVGGAIYTDPARNEDMFVGDHVRTGDLGRLDEDGYLWITGRDKDLIIRGGGNIDPAIIEDALLSHPDIAFAGAIGQPDAYAGELPCAYIELVDGATTTPEALTEFAKTHIPERAAIPKHLEILPELPKTAIGKVYKPALRNLAIKRVYDEALAGLGASVAEVMLDTKRGHLARIQHDPDADRAKIKAALDAFTIAWEWA